MPPSQQIHEEAPPVSDEIVEEEVEETKAVETGPEPQMQISVTPPAPVRPEPIIKQTPRQETPPKRSKEVQAYLDFVEGMGNKRIELVKKGLHRLLALIP